MRQPDLFNQPAPPPPNPTGQELKEEGMALAILNAHELWKARFSAEIERVANLGRPFTCEDITQSIGLPPSGSPNAIGALMSSAAHRLCLKRIGFVEANRTSRHRAIVAQWQREF